MKTSSPYPMIGVDEALKIILDCADPLGSMTVPFERTAGMVLAEDVYSREDLPAAPRSAVDGYAVSALPGPTRLRLLGEVTAGVPSQTRVDATSALRIMTGGLLPPGADAVVMVEETSELDGWVEMARGASSGDNVTPVGHDLRRGELVLQAGTRIGPAEIGMLATVGAVRPSVFRRPRVAALATGDELVLPEENPPVGSVRDSNRFALVAAAKETGADVVWSEHRRDDAEALRSAVLGALDVCDVLVTSGGVSMGTRDLIKPLLADIGQVRFGRIAFKPGKPLTFVTVGPKLVFGLPGYPVSSLVTFEVFARPALLRLQGLREVLRPRVSVALEHALKPDRSRLEYQRGVVRCAGSRLTAHSTGAQSSSRLASMVGANALLEIPSGEALIPAGANITALLTGAILA